MVLIHNFIMIYALYMFTLTWTCSYQHSPQLRGEHTSHAIIFSTPGASGLISM